MKVTKFGRENESFIIAELRSAIFLSRFEGVVEMDKAAIKIANVRLKQKKLYCGNHPNACEGLFQREHRKGYWLEGADWVEFNDLLNDVFDRLNLSANIASSVVILRKGFERCIEYTSTRQGNFMQWDKDSRCFENYCGRTAPASLFPEGTPGNYKDSYSCEG